MQTNRLELLDPLRSVDPLEVRDPADDGVAAHGEHRGREGGGLAAQGVWEEQGRGQQAGGQGDTKDGVHWYKNTSYSTGNSIGMAGV